jgi:hypothetical protein
MHLRVVVARAQLVERRYQPLALVVLEVHHP